jgi:hypothetical protein
MAKCVACREREAVLRDRENPTSHRKKVCRECHAKRLAGDLLRIVVGLQEAHGEFNSQSDAKAGS